jgi:hypothetical protein
MELTDVEARAVIGPRHEYYVGQWRREGPRKFNRAAFWFSGAWLPFRRMYWATIAFYIAIPALDSAVNILLGEPVNPQQFVARGAACTVIAGAVCGFWGNRWYQAHVMRVVSMVRARNLPQEEHLRRLRAVGGTRLTHAVGAILLLVAVAWSIDHARM